MIDWPQLRDRTGVFHDRRAAGAVLADLLEAARELEAETESGQRVHGPEGGPVAQLRSILWDAVSSGRWMPLEDDEGPN